MEKTSLKIENLPPNFQFFPFLKLSPPLFFFCFWVRDRERVKSKRKCFQNGLDNRFCSTRLGDVILRSWWVINRFLNHTYRQVWHQSTSKKMKLSRFAVSKWPRRRLNSPTNTTPCLFVSRIAGQTINNWTWVKFFAVTESSTPLMKSKWTNGKFII